MSRLATAVLVIATATTSGLLAYRFFSLDPGLRRDDGEVRLVPVLTLPDLQGKPRALSEWKGRPLLINFWATWCEPCRREIPLLKKLRAEHAAEGLEVLGIAMDFPDAVAAYAKEAGIEYPLLMADQNGLAPEAFGIGMSLPTTVFADRQGRITAVKVGELSARRAEQLLKSITKAP